MSNSLAIAAVTRTVKLLLFQGMTDELGSEDDITTLPPDKAREGKTGDQINLFLYHITYSAAWRNMDVPRQVRPGETGQPPLPLTLEYLVTAYGGLDDDIRGHTLIGRAMSILQDHPLLMPAEIKAAFDNSGLDQQVERVRIAAQPLSTHDMYELWTGFQTPYRISAGYQISVVLIDSTRPSNAPLPVLRRGKKDQGVFTVPSGPASLSGIEPDVIPRQIQFAALLGDDLLLTGQELDPANASVRFFSPFTGVIELTPLAGSTSELLRVNVAGTFAQWAPGFYRVSVVIRKPDLPPWTTNEFPLGIAPSIVPSLPGGALRISATPQVRPDQRVLLLLGGQQFAAPPFVLPAGATDPTVIDFPLAGLPKGTDQVVRLRVDGVDSIPLLRNGKPPVLDTTGFDPAQKVTIA